MSAAGRVVAVAAVVVLGAAAAWSWRARAPAPPPPPAPEAKPSPKKAKPKAEGPPGLKLPAKKPCLPPPTGEGLGDEGMAGSAGLSEEQVASAMSAFLPNTLRCQPADGPLAGTVTADVTVGCDGRVASVRVADAGGLPEGFVGCVADTLRYAPFPAHDLPDGYEFQFPLTFSP